MDKTLFGWLLIGALLAFEPRSVQGSTITFVENESEGPVTTMVDLSDCATCTLVTMLGMAEQGVAAFTRPNGFPGFTAGLTSAQAILVEPAGTAEGALAG